jgi:hypothetical protein
MLLSGNVAVSVLEGSLVVKGDHAGNSIIVDQVGLTSQQFRITSGLSATTINGGASPLVFSGVTDDVRLKMGGNDTVVLSAVKLPHNLLLRDATGTGTMALNNSTVAGKMKVATKQEQLHFSASSSTVSRDMTISNRGGGSTVQLNTTSVGRRLLIKEGKDTSADAITLAGVHVSRRTRIHTGSAGDTVTVEDSCVFDGNFRLATGLGSDIASLLNSTFNRSLVVLMGGGTDTTNVGVGGPITVKKDAVFDGGSGTDTINILTNGNTFADGKDIDGYETTT